MTLRWIKLRCEGLSSGAIAERFGVIPGRVRTATQRVRQADIEESGEDVEGAYW